MPRCRSGRTSRSTSSQPTCPTSRLRRRSAPNRKERGDMRITQGTFSYLPDLTDEEIEAQLKYSVSNGWAISIEYCAAYEIHPRHAYWEMWGLPHFDVKVEDTENIMREVRASREAFPEHYIKVIAYDPTRGRQTTALAIFVNRPSVEKPFFLDRIQGPGRTNSFRYIPDENTPANGKVPAASSNGASDGQVADGG